MLILSGCSRSGSSFLASDSEGTTPSTPSSGCPTNYTEIPANVALGTSTFCVAQYEMKASLNDGTPVFDAYTSALDPSLHKPDSRPNGIPWVRITHSDAQLECASLGTGYSLITAAQWAALARDAESVTSNWDNGGVGTGKLYTAHSDSTTSATAIADGLAVTGSALLSAGTGVDHYAGTGNSSNDAWGSGKEQRRTLYLTSGEVVWDLAGNAREKVAIDSAGSTLSYTGPATSNYFDPQSATVSSMVNTIAISGGGTFDLNWLTPTSASQTHVANAVGQIYILSNVRTGRVLTRGGNFSSGNSPGLYAADLDSDAVNVSSSAGFRCVYVP